MLAKDLCLWLLAAQEPRRRKEQGQLRHRTVFKPIMALPEGQEWEVHEED